MPTTPTQLASLPADALTAELARREDEAQRKQAAAEASWKIEQAKRARVILDGWKIAEEELLTSAAEAEAAFRGAVLADPMVAAYIRVRWHRYRRNALRTEAQTAAHVLGETQTAERITPLTDWGSRLFDEVTALMDAEAQRLASEDSQAVLEQLNKPENF